MTVRLGGPASILWSLMESSFRRTELTRRTTILELHDLVGGGAALVPVVEPAAVFPVGVRPWQGDVLLVPDR